MGHGHHHHHHHHHDIEDMSERRLWWAVAANMILTVAQVSGGVVSGSLSLVADAVHNLSDAMSLVIAAVAIRIGRKPADQMKTFGYKRAETVAALINLTSLILIGVYLCYEAVMRFFVPTEIAGWTVVIVAGVALIVDVFTAIMTYRGSKTSMNMQAAFMHNLTDAMASVGVIIAGTLILLYGWLWADTVMTLMIAGYILWYGVQSIPRVIHLLMEGVPEGIEIDDIISRLESVDGVTNIHHVHLWQLDEHRNALEAHVVMGEGAKMDDLKTRLKAILHDEFEVTHSTLEFEEKACGATCYHP